MNLISEPSNQGISLSVQDLFHYQLLAKQLKFPLQNTPTSTQHGDKQTRLKGRGMTFTDLRQYEKGDDVRLIDWRVTARLGTPHTRQYNEDKSQPYYLFLDYAPSMFFGSKRQLKSVVATKLAATLMWQVRQHSEPLGLFTVNPSGIDFLRPASSQRQLLKCLSRTVHASQWNFDCSNPEPNEIKTAVNSVNTEHQNKILQSLHLILNNIQSGCVVMLVSDFINWSKAMVELCHQLGERGQLLLYFIGDPIESSNRTYPKQGISLMFTDGINTQKRLLEKTQVIKNVFLEDKIIRHYPKTNVSTHLPLVEQLGSRLL